MKWKLSASLWLPLGGALVAAVAAFLFMQLYLEAYIQSSPQVVPLPAEHEHKTQVVVARQALASNHVLTLEQLSVRSVSPVGLATDHIKPASAEQLIGARLAHPVAAGQPVQWLHLAPAEVPKFSAQLATGYRAYTLPLGLEQNHAGLLQVADRVDLVMQQAGQLEVVASNVLVLAVDGETELDANAASVSRNGARSATFALSLEQLTRVQQGPLNKPLQVWLRGALDQQHLHLKRRSVEWIVAGLPDNWAVDETDLGMYDPAQGQWQ